MTQASPTCVACLELQQRVEKEAVFEAKTLRCYAGLSESAVPVRIGANVLGYLQTGQVFLRGPSPQCFKAALRAIPGAADYSEAELRVLKAAYLQTRIIPAKQYEMVIRLLGVFAEHLASVSNQMLIVQTATESPLITKARTFIAQHKDEVLGLKEAAHAVNMSPFYFCKFFKKGTGFTFTDYLARTRVEFVKQMLLDVHMRVSEAAYAAGFQSLSQFNRVFRRVAGEAPSFYRARLHETKSK